MTPHKPDVCKANLCPPCPKTASIWEKCVYWLGIGMGFGLPKRAAGTWGTVGGLLVAVPMIQLGLVPFILMTVVGCLVGSYVCGKTSSLMGVHDDPHIVFDEWVGMWIALIPSVWLLHHELDDLYPLSSERSDIYFSLALLLVPFVLFRFFDIIKPFPIKWVDKNVAGGFGILIDDVLAGIMSAIAMLGIVFL